MKIGTYVKTSRGKVGRVVQERVEEDQPYVQLGSKTFQIHEKCLDPIKRVRINIGQEHVEMPCEDMESFTFILRKNKIKYNLS